LRFLEAANSAQNKNILEFITCLSSVFYGNRNFVVSVKYLCHDILLYLFKFELIVINFIGGKET